MSRMRTCWLLALFVAAFAPESFAEQGDSKWSFQTLGEVFGSPAVGVDGSIYFGSRDGKLYSLDADGGLRWEFMAGDWVDSAPTLNEDETQVYFGSWNNFLYAVSTVDGRELWKFETGSLVASSPALDKDGNLYFGSSDGFFYSLDKEGVLRWSFFVGAELDCSPAVGEDGSIYVGGYDGVLYSFSADGELLWEFSARESEEADGSRIAGPIAIGEDGVVYFGSADGYCYAVDSMGELVWEFEAFEKVDTGVVIGNDGELIFASRSGYVYAVDGFGVLIWESFVGDIFYSTPAVDSDGRVYVGSYVGEGVSSLNALDSEGGILWSYLVFDYIDSPPVVSADGHVVFGCYDGALYAVEAGASPGLSSWGRFGGGEANRSLRLPYEPVVLTEKFGSWLSVLGLSGVYADPCFDGDKDGRVLALEYLLGSDATESDGSCLEAGTEFFEGSRRAYLEYSMVLGDDELDYVLETSSGGAGWSELSLLDGTTEVLVDADIYGDGWYEKRRVYLPESVSDGVLFRIRMSCN